MQWVAFNPGGEMRAVDAILRLSLGKALHVRFAVVMRRKHNMYRRQAVDLENVVQNMHHKVHRGDIVVVDDHPVHRLQLSLTDRQRLDLRDRLRL